MFQNTRQLILKVTRGCNLRCSYCYVFDKDNYDKEQMSDEVFETTIRKWLSVSKLSNTNISPLWPRTKDKSKAPDWYPLELVFHGGEPLKIGKEKFSKFCKIAMQLSREYHKMLKLSVQTNATLIDDEWISIFKKYNISPGISFDGFEDSSENRGLQGKVLENLIKLRSKGINFGIISITNNKNITNTISNFKQLQTIGINSVKMNRVVDVSGEHPEVEVSVDDLIDNDERILLYMFSTGFNESTLYQKLIAYREGMTFGQEHNRGEICYTRYCGAGNAIIEIEPDGSALFCGRNSRKNDNVTSGNIFSKDVGELIHGKKMWDFHKSKVIAINDRKCNLCSSQSFCDYGCLSFSYQKYGKGIIDDQTCDYNKKLSQLFDKYRYEIEKLLKDKEEYEPNSNYFL